MSKFYWMQICATGLALSTALILAIITAPNSPSTNKSINGLYTNNLNFITTNRDAQSDFRFYDFAPSSTNDEFIIIEEKNDLIEEKIDALNFDEANLLAQERVAHWTAWIGAFTTIGLFALLVTLIETRQVTAVTRDIGQKQVRAYIHIDSVHLDTRSSDVTEGVRLCISAHNSGQSRAVAPIATYTMTTFDGDFILTGLVELPPIENGQTKTRWDFIKFENLIHLANNKLSDMHLVYLKLCLSYNDVFGKSDRVYSAAIIKFNWDDEDFIHEMEEVPLVDQRLISLSNSEHDKIVEQYRKKIEDQFQKLKSE